MDDPQQSHFTLIDLFWEVFHVALIAIGCYVGWKISQHFLSLLVGGIAVRIVAVGLVRAMKASLG